jgi:hypothetical protein
MSQGKLIRDREMARVLAAMRFGAGDSVAEIAKLLKVSEKSVYKLRSEAIDKKMLARADIFNPKDVPPGVLLAAECEVEKRRGSRDELLVRLRTALSIEAGFEVRVRICGSNPTLESRLSLTVIARNAAPYLKELLINRDVHTAAVAYGSAVRSLLVELRKISEVPFRRANPVTCVPLRGDAGLGAVDTPSVLAHYLCETLNGVDTDERHWRAPTATPPVLPDPRKFKLGGRVLAETLKTYLGLFPDGEECFGEMGLIRRDVQLVVTSVGPPLPVSPITQWIFDLAGFDTRTLPLVGDVAGIPILDSRRDTEAQRASVTRFEEESLIGATSTTFRETISRGGRVVAVVFDDVTRARCLLEMVRKGMATDLLVDRRVAKEVDRLIKSDAAN